MKTPLNRQVLVLTDDVSIRNLFYLMRKLATKDVADGASRAMRAIAEREQYDAVVLDMRCSDSSPEGQVNEIGKVQSSRVERLQTITAEVNGQETLALVERYLLSGLPGALAALAGYRSPSSRQFQPC